MIVRISNWPGSVSGYNGIVQPADCRPRHAYFRYGSLADIRERSGMSALPPKADMFSVKIDVCFVPLADTALVFGARA